MKKIVYGVLILAFSIFVVAAGCQVMQSQKPSVTGQAAPPGAPVMTALWTTDSTGTKVNQNPYALKTDVYLAGGTAEKGQGNPQGGLPDGDHYYVLVTSPKGTICGSNSPAMLGVTEIPDVKYISIVNGIMGYYPAKGINENNPDAAVQLWAYCWQIDPSDPTKVIQGYADSDVSQHDEYKVTVSADPNFAQNSAHRSDNFFVTPPNETTTTVQPPTILEIIKYYDANANGIKDNGEGDLTGWKMNVNNMERWTPYTETVPDPGNTNYTIYEYAPNETNWVATENGPALNPLTVTPPAGQTTTVKFGNVSLGGGGGLTLGFWSNKNGQALVGADDISMLVGLNLRNANGTDFDPANYASFRTWILKATATNMAYMLSAQLAAMELNVFNGKVSNSALIYLLYGSGYKDIYALKNANPDLFDKLKAIGMNDYGFISLTTLMAAANTELGLHGLTVSASADRTFQEFLKTALDKANNDNPMYVLLYAAPATF